MNALRTTATPAKPRPARKLPRRRRRKTKPKPDVIVVGGSRRTRAIIKALGRLDMVVRHCAAVEEALESAAESTRAFVAVFPLEGAVPRAVVETLGSGEPRPVFAVVSDAFSDRRARELYEAGVAAVFEWPHEATLLPAMITDLVGSPPKRGARGDASLARSVRSRLRASRLATDGISVRVIGGVARLSGAVPSYWQKQRVEQMLGHVPGIIGVVVMDVAVEPEPRTDKDIARHVRNVLRSASETDPRTINVSVQEGRVRLAGSVSSRDELERLTSMVANIAGVRDVEINVVVTKSGTLAARGLASRLRSALNSLWPTAEVDVTVFGHVAVLAGHTRTLADKQAIKAHALGLPGIGRVVNKIRVLP